MHDAAYDAIARRVEELKAERWKSETTRYGILTGLQIALDTIEVEAQRRQSADVTFAARMVEPERWKAGTLVRGKNTGALATIIGHVANGSYWARMADDSTSYVNDRYWELAPAAPFKVGDRVKHRKGTRVGTVTRIAEDSDGRPYVAVAFEDGHRSAYPVEVTVKVDEPALRVGARVRTLSGRVGTVTQLWDVRRSGRSAADVDLGFWGTCRNIPADLLEVLS